jgi:hypothetical protein
VKVRPLFSVRDRNDPSPKTGAEGIFAFLDRVADPAFHLVRRLLESWFSHLPAEAVDDIRGRLRDRRPEQFASAFLELYLHELHLRLGYELDVHPSVPGTTRRPDFLVSKSGCAHYVEAAVVGPPDHETAPDNRARRIVDALNRVRSDDYALLFEIEEYGTTAPSMRQIRSEIETWLDRLDWENDRAAVEGGTGAGGLPARSWSRGDWHFTVRAWPKAPGQRGKSGPAIWAGPGGGGVYDDAGAIREVLQRKASAYGRPNHPLLLALHVDRVTADNEDVASALFGPNHGLPDAHDAGLRLSGEGLWKGPSGLRRRRVAAVVTWGVEFRPWSIARERPTYWSHPEATDVVLLPRFDPIDVFDLPEIDQFEDPREWPGRPLRHLNE